MIIDLFGSHSRYARRNRGSALKAELQAVSGPEKDSGRNGIPSLSALFSEPVVKRGAEKLSKTELPKCVGMRIRTITRCDGSTCIKQKICE